MTGTHMPEKCHDPQKTAALHSRHFTSALGALGAVRLPAPMTCRRSPPALSPMSLCSETFVSGLEPDRIVCGDHRRDARRRPHHMARWTTRSTARAKDVTVTLLGVGKSHAVYRGEGFGCYLDSRHRRRRYLAAADGRQGSTIAARNRGRIDRRARKARSCDRARPRLCRAGQPAASPHQGGRGGERRPCHRRALRRTALASTRRCSASPPPNP